MKKVFLLLLVLFVMPCLAHEFWLSPERFIFQKKGQANIRLFVGEDFDGEPWKGDIMEVAHYTQKGKNLQKKILENLRIDSLQRSFPLELSASGTQILTLRSSTKFLQLAAEQFNAYLEEDGLQEIIAYRQEKGLQNTPGREKYERCAKLLLHVGALPNPKAKNSAALANTGMPLEILPLANPYTLPKGKNGDMQFRILFQGKPLAGQHIKLWQRIGEQLVKQEAESDKEGLVSFAQVRCEGRVMISTVKMIAHDNPQEADWHSYWGSLVFGYE